MTTKNKFFPYKWSDGQRVWWRFMYAAATFRTFDIHLECNYHESYETEGWHTEFTVMALGKMIRVSLPKWILRPAKIQKLDYVSLVQRSYGCYLYANHFVVSYGRHTHDTETEQEWSCLLPWSEKRFHAHRYYGYYGETVKEFRGMGNFNNEWAFKESDRLPKVKFSLKDFDGEAVIATTYLEERHWKHGTKAFKWLSWFVPDMKRRSLDLHFSTGIGEEKGSYKGGTIGHSIEVLPGELHESAMRRYCAEHNMTFVGRVE